MGGEVVILHDRDLGEVLTLGGPGGLYYGQVSVSISESGGFCGFSIASLIAAGVMRIGSKNLPSRPQVLNTRAFIQPSIRSTVQSVAARPVTRSGFRPQSPA